MLEKAKAGNATTLPDAIGMNPVEYWSRANDFVRRHSAEDVSFDPGQLYTVDIPEDSELLDWDKPLSEQPESVRQALKNAPFETGGGDWTGRDLLEMAQAYAKASQSGKYVVGGVDPKAGSDLLKSLGIPGIRYLDGGSRAGGQGTSNFVVFPGNEGILKILSRE
jgi:hypothetical protein